MFKQIRIYRIDSSWECPTGAALEAAFKKAAFKPLGATEKRSLGWVAPRPQDHSTLIEVVGGQWLFQLQRESKSVPGGVLKKALEARCKKIEAETGRKPGRNEKKELKADIELELLPRAFSKTSATLVWFSPDQHWLVVGSANQGIADDVVTALVEATQEAGSIMPILPLTTHVLPSAAISQWLLAKEAPVGFTLDRDLELRQPDNEKSVVRYARHNLEIDEVVEHIRAGKMPTQVAMTWESRVSFVLAADMTLRKLELLDAVFDESLAEEASFEGDVAIVTGELSKLIPELIVALGGELAQG